MLNVSAAEVQQAMTDEGLTSFTVRNCSLCESPLGYIRRDDKLFFDSDCDCSSFSSGLQPREWQAAADCINMQTNLVSRNKMRNGFGLQSES